MTAKSPVTLLRQWFEEAQAAGAVLPLAASLASASLPSGRVSSRMVNTRGLNAAGNIEVFSDFAHSRKGRDIATNPQVALTFYWPGLNRSARVEGTLHVMSKSDSETYFHSRPHDFQASVHLGAPEGGQSQVVTGNLEQRMAELNSATKLEVPDYWRGAEVRPLWVEFWQGTTSRVSERTAYSWEEGEWTVENLTP